MLGHPRRYWLSRDIAFDEKGGFAANATKSDLAVSDVDKTKGLHKNCLSANAKVSMLETQCKITIWSSVEHNITTNCNLNSVMNPVFHHQEKRLVIWLLEELFYYFIADVMSHFVYRCYIVETARQTVRRCTLSPPVHCHTCPSSIVKAPIPANNSFLAGSAIGMAISTKTGVIVKNRRCCQLLPIKTPIPVSVPV